MTEYHQYADSQEEYVTVLKSTIDRLEERERWLQCLEDAGVDNWQGMEEAIDIWREWKNG